MQGSRIGSRCEDQLGLGVRLQRHCLVAESPALLKDSLRSRGHATYDPSRGENPKTFRSDSGASMVWASKMILATLLFLATCTGCDYVVSCRGRLTPLTTTLPGSREVTVVEVSHMGAPAQYTPTQASRRGSLKEPSPGSPKRSSSVQTPCIGQLTTQASCIGQR